ncbi:MAG: hypothetical protein LC101_11210 [Flavobacteriales bacterium]|nr:hypothetical protein [Flavobacteriales bacterium]MCZ2444330.1 hypothetical protein [Flavobacteriales bacterium]
MKKLIILFAPFVLFACGGGSQANIDQMKKELDSLKNLQAESSATVDVYIGDLNDIYESLEEVKRKEGAISKTAAGGGEIAADKKTLIQEDIMLIDQMMQENRDKLESLRSKVKKSDKKMAELEKLIANLQKQIEEKDSQIAGLKLQLEGLNIELENLSASYDNLNKENETNKETIGKQTEELNTVYFAMGTFKELVDNKVLDKGGALTVKSGSKLAADVNIDYFTKADLRTLKDIKVGNRKITIKSSHPTGSYTLEPASGKTEKLVINDAQAFWKNTKYCVIVFN